MATVNPGIRVLAIVGVFFAAAMLCAQDAPFVMKLDSNSILVDVTVTDSAKKPVTNLPRDAFRIYEDGSFRNSLDSIPSRHRIAFCFSSIAVPARKISGHCCRLRWSDFSMR